MDKDKSAVESFLSELDTKDDKQPFENNQEDPFPQEVPEETGEVVREERPLPFNRDPKIQKYIQKQISKHLEELREEREERPETIVDDDYYARLIGNDTPEKVAMIREAVARDERMLQEAEERAFDRLSAVEQQEVQADQEAEEELEDAFESIEETFDVDITSNNAIATRTRHEFVSFVERIAPKDRNGDIVDYPDMVQAFETFSDLRKSTATPSRAKELASRSMARSSEAPSAKDIKGLNFDNIIEHITSQ